MNTETQHASETKQGKNCPSARKNGNGPLPLPWKNILVPTDLSEPSKRALKTAAALAQKCGAKLILLHVAQMPICCSFDAPPEAGEMMDLARKSLDDIARTIPADVAVETIVRFGTREPVEQIVEEANKVSADLIVIATHGYSGIKRVLLGGTAERVIRHAPCPVLVVRFAGDSSQPTPQRANEPENPFRTN